MRLIDGLDRSRVEGFDRWARRKIGLLDCFGNQGNRSKENEKEIEKKERLLVSESMNARIAKIAKVFLKNPTDIPV
jgi:hypothetical protein